MRHFALFLAFVFSISTGALATDQGASPPLLAVFDAGFPYTIIKFKDQPESSKVLAVTVGHKFATQKTKFEGQLGPFDESTGKDQSKMIPSRQFSDMLGFELGNSWVCPLESYLECMQNGSQKYDDVYRRMRAEDPYPPSGRLLYFSQIGMDLMVIEFDLTYEDLRKTRGIVPFIVDEATPSLEDAAVFYSQMSKTLQENAEPFQVCQFSRVAEVAFNNGALRFEGLYAYHPTQGTSCRSIPGDSGSPVINPKTLEILGIVTGSNQVDSLFVTPLRSLKSCLDQNFRFNLYLPSCRLQQIRYHGGR